MKKVLFLSLFIVVIGSACVGDGFERTDVKVYVTPTKAIVIEGNVETSTLAPTATDTPSATPTGTPTATATSTEEIAEAQVSFGGIGESTPTMENVVLTWTPYPSVTSTVGADEQITFGEQTEETREPVTFGNAPTERPTVGFGD